MTQSLHISLTIDGTPIEAAVPVPTAPSPKRTLLPILHSLSNTIVSLAEQSHPAPVSCKKGCDACCRQMVPIAPTEAHALAALLDSLPPTKAAKYLSRFDQAMDTLDAKGLLPALMNRHKLTPDQLQQLDKDYFAAQIACPFLDNKACSIHSQRPLSCREYLVSSPPKSCRNPTADKVTQLPMPAKVSLALTQSDNAAWLPLTLARHYVSKHKDRPTPSPAKALTQILNSL